MSTSPEQIRKYLFDLFSAQLHILVEKGILNICPQYEKTYICPICLRQFGEEALTILHNINHLTLEDAPPAALGGNKVALTCKECNSRCGYKIDSHLTEALKGIDASYFYKDTIHHGYILNADGEKVNVELTSFGNGTLQAYHRINNNNPNFLKKLIYGLETKTFGPILNFERRPSKLIPERINYALVKANYILTFGKFGYLFLLHPIYNSIREQLLNPEQVIYPYTPFIKNNFKKANIGTYYIYNEGIRSILNVFNLRTKYSETILGGTMPPPTLSTPEYGARIDALKDHNNIVAIKTGNYDPSANLFRDFKEMKIVIQWING